MKKIVVILWFIIAVSASNLAQIPRTLNYQGVLAGSEGTLVPDDDYNITFTLYGSSDAAAGIWSETQTVHVENGIFNVILGSVTPLDLLFDNQYWIGISINGGDELSPRIMLTSSAYSFNVINIPDSIVTPHKVRDGSLVRSLNGLTDNIIINPGSNIGITDDGENTITISANTSDGLSLPFKDSISSVSNVFDITNSEIGATINAKNTHDLGVAGYFSADNPSGSGDALYCKANGKGTVITGYTTGKGSAGEFIINNVNSQSNVLLAINHGLGDAGYFKINNSKNNYNAVTTVSNGTGNSLFAYNTGRGKAIFCKIDNELNQETACDVYTNGLGLAARFEISNASSLNDVIFAKSNGMGNVIYALTSNSMGSAGRFEITNTGNTGNAIFGTTSGVGKAVYGHAKNSGNVENYGGYFLAEGSKARAVYGFADNPNNVTNYGGYFVANGQTGYGIWAEATSETGINYGGHFSTASISGRAIRGHATAKLGENYGGAFRADGNFSRAVWAFGQAYDYYAAGPGVNYGAASSIRWKNNIVEIDNPLEKLTSLRGVYFDWDEEHGGRHDIGIIAEEVGEVIPEIVSYEINSEYADGMDYSKLAPLLVEALKAQQKMIEELKAEVQELKALLNK